MADLRLTDHIYKIITDLEEKGLNPKCLYIYPIAYDEWVKQIDQAVLFQRAELRKLPKIFELKGFKCEEIFPHLLIITEDEIDIQKEFH